MKLFLTIICFISVLYASENMISLDYTSLKQEDTKEYHCFSWNGTFEDRVSFLAGDLDVRAGIAFHKNMQFKQGTSDTIIDDDRMIVSSLALDYYIQNTLLLSVGRESMNLNLLTGSFDGALVVGNYGDVQAKVFYFRHYTSLQSTYYENYALKDLYGAHLAYSTKVWDSEVTFFSNGKNSISNVYLSYKIDSLMLGGEYLSLHSSTFDDEASAKVFVAYKHKDFVLEGGMTHVYQGSLKHVYDLGGSDFTTFPLGSFLNQKNAKNVYFDIVYNYSYYYAKLHLGETIFDEENRACVGEEVGLTLGMQYKQYEFYIMLLTQRSKQLENQYKRTNWLQINLKYRF